MAYEPQQRGDFGGTRDFVTDQGGRTTGGPHFAATGAARTANAGSTGMFQGRDSWPKIPGFDLLERLGDHAHGTMYKARQVDPHRSVALRVIETAMAGGETELARLLASAEALAAVQHPNIEAVYSAGRWDGGVFVASELLENDSLAEKLAGIPQNERHAAELVETLARAMHFCHERQIVHRSLKPSNVLFTDHDVAKITEIGLFTAYADQTRSQGAAARETAAYVAPELAAGGHGQAEPASDVYALGAMLYEMLVGRPPFLAESAAETLTQILAHHPIPPRELRPKVSPALEAICLQCLEKDPHARYASAEDLANDLRCFLDGHPVAARPMHSLVHGLRWCQNHALMSGTVGTIALVLVASLVALLFRIGHLSMAHALALAERNRAASRVEGMESEFQRLNTENARLSQQGNRPGGANFALAGPSRLDNGAPGPNTMQLSPDELRRQYVSQIQLARQAWDRGESGVARQLLEPYANDPARQNLRTFAWYYLWRAATSDAVQFFHQHKQTVRNVAFTPDGTAVVTLGDDGALILWDPRTGKSLQSVTLDRGTNAAVSFLLGHSTTRSGGLALAPDGWWTAAFGKTLWLGDFRKAGQPRQIAQQTGTITALALARDGKLLAAGDDKGNLVLRGLPDGGVVRQWSNTSVRAVAFSRDGKFLVGGTAEGRLLTWDLASGMLQASELFSQPVNAVACSNDGQLVAVAVADRGGVVRLWEPALRRVRAEIRGHQDEVTDVAFAPDGTTILTASRDQTARLWTLTGSPVRTFKGHAGEVVAAAFAPDGQHVVTGSADTLAVLWNTYGNQEYETLTGTPATGWIDSIQFTPGGEALVAAGCGENSEAFLSKWNLADLPHPLPVQVPAHVGSAVGFSPDSRLIAVGEITSADATAPSRAKVWNLDSGRVVATLPEQTGRITAIAFTPDARQLLTAVGDRDERIAAQVRFWDASTAAPRLALPDLSGRMDAAISADGKLLVTVAQRRKRPGEIRLWNPVTGEALGQVDGGAELDNISNMLLAPDGRTLVTAHGDFNDPNNGAKVKINLWDLAQRRLLGPLPPAHSACISRLAFTRRGMVLASGDLAGSVRLWDFPQRKLLGVQLKQEGRRITSLAFDWYGQRLATGADENRIRVWDVDTGRELARLELTTGAPAVIRFTPDGNSLVATTSTGGLIAWDSESYRVRRVLQTEGTMSLRDGHAGEINVAVVSYNGQQLLTGGADKSVRAWDLKTGKFLGNPYTAKQAIACLAVSPDGRRMAIGSGRYKSVFEPGEVVLATADPQGNLSNPQPIAQGLAATSIAFSPDGGLLAIAGLTPQGAQGFTQSLTLVNLASGKQYRVGAGSPFAVTFAPNVRMLAVGHSSGAIELWSLENDGAPAPQPLSLPRQAAAVAALAFAPDGQTLVTGGYDKNANVWDVATGSQLLLLKHNGAIENVRFSPDGATLAITERADAQGAVRLWRAK